MKSLAKKTLVATLFAGLALSAGFGGVAEAQKKGKAKKAKAQRVKTYDFTGDEIQGDLVKPDGEFLDTRKFASHTSLIRIRKDFIREMVKTADRL